MLKALNTTRQWFTFASKGLLPCSRIDTTANQAERELCLDFNNRVLKCGAA
jgi:hypothetical protein